MSEYIHPSDNNLSNLHKAMAYDSNGEPSIRVNIPTVTVNVPPPEVTVDVQIPPVEVNIPPVEIPPVQVNIPPVEVNIPPVDVILPEENPATLSSFQRLRTTNTRYMGEYRFMYGESTAIFELNSLSANGGTYAIDYTNKLANLNVTTANGSRIVLQSKQYHNYLSGSNMLFYISFIMNTPTANVSQLAGCYDDKDGIFFRMNGTSPEIVVRKEFVETAVVPQALWNVNQFLDLDFSKGQTLIVEHDWMGIGRVRVGFMQNGLVKYAHQFIYTNSSTTTFINQPSLPVRWEIYNTAATATASTLKAVCASVYEEGNDIELGFRRSVSTGLNTVPVTTATGRGILAFRLKNTIGGITSKASARIKAYNLTATNDMMYKIVMFPSSAAIQTATWLDVPGRSFCQYATNIELVANWQTLDYANIKESHVYSSTPNKAGYDAEGTEDDRSLHIFQNYNSTDSQVIMLIGFRVSQDAQCRANMSWIELK